MALGVSWKQHMTNSELYGRLPKVTSKITERRLRLAGHIFRHPELTANKLLHWEPLHSDMRIEIPNFTFEDCLKANTGLKNKDEIGNLMLDRSLWRDVVKGAREFHRREETPP